jgi:hypothetical protein
MLGHWAVEDYGGSAATVANRSNQRLWITLDVPDLATDQKGGFASLMIRLCGQPSARTPGGPSRLTAIATGPSRRRHVNCPTREGQTVVIPRATLALIGTSVPRPDQAGPARTQQQERCDASGDGFRYMAGAYTGTLPQATARTKRHMACIMSDMDWVSSVIIPVGVSLATAVAISLTVGPRLAARAKRIQAFHDARDQFRRSIVDILAMCANLRGAVLPDDATEHHQSVFQAERNRWEAQISDVTVWLIDHWQGYAFTYIGTAGIRDLINRYAFTARGIWISSRPLQERVRMLQDLSQPMLTIFVASRWYAARRIPGEVQRLNEMFDSIEGLAPPDGATAGTD